QRKLQIAFAAFYGKDVILLVDLYPFRQFNGVVCYSGHSRALNLNFRTVYCLLENGAENLATHACCASLLVRHQSLVGGNDHHAQAATIVRHFFLAFVYTQSWSAVALDLFDNGFALIVFEIYRQNGFATFFSNRET